MSVFGASTNFPSAFSNQPSTFSNQPSTFSDQPNSNNSNNNFNSSVFGKTFNNNSNRNNGDTAGYSDSRRSGNAPGNRKRKVHVHTNTNNNPNNGNAQNNKNNSNDTNKTSKRFNDRNQDRKKPFKKKDKGDKNSDSNTPIRNFNDTHNSTNFAFTSSSATPDPSTMDTPAKVLPRQSEEKFQSYTAAENEIIGNLFPNPESLGFLPQQKRTPRPVPRYMSTQPRQLETPPFIQNDWDRSNQLKMQEMEASNSGKDVQGLYEEFQKMRETERAKMEQLGLVDAENISKDLNDAISFQGSCLDMCPIFERVRRALENNVKALEKDPITNKISPQRAIKAFSRPAAGQPPPLPSEVRPPHILKQTLDHIVDEVVPQLPNAHSFIWDRTRSIRQDFTYQNFFGPEAIDCNERIVRIHLVSLHVMAGADIEYSQQQELEQFNKALQTLVEIYQDIRNHGGRAPNEAEFRAYHLLSHYKDPELEREIQQLPDDIFSAQEVQLALKLRAILSQNNIVERGFVNSVGALNLFSEFFKLVYSEKTPFLVACLLETHFNEIRFYALKSMSRCYHTRGKAYPAALLKDMLGFDNMSEMVTFVEYYEIDTLTGEGGELLVDLFNKDKLESKYKLNSPHDKPKLLQPCSKQIDDKLMGQPLKAFINCGYPTFSLNLRTSSDRELLKSNNLDTRILKKPSLTAAMPPSSIFGGASAQTTSTNNQNSKSLADFLNTSQQSNAKNGFGGTSTPSFGKINNGMSAPENPPKAPFSTPLPGSNAPASSFGHANNLPTSKNPPFNNSGIQQTFPQPTKIATSASKPLFSQPSSSEITSNQQPTSGLFNGNRPNQASSLGSGTPFMLSGADAKKQQAQAIDSSKATAPAVSFQSQPNGGSVFPSVPVHKASPGLAKISVSSPAVPAIPVTPAAKKLKDSKYFDPALKSVFNEILQTTIASELGSFLPKLIRIDNRNQERTEIINSFSNELYHAFLSELIFKQALEVQADNFYKKHLQIFIIKRLSQKGAQSKTKQELRRKKLEELKSISFKVPAMKRKLSSASVSSWGSGSNLAGRRRIPSHENDTMSLEDIEERQNEVRKLWEPLNLKKFVNRCSTKLRLNIEASDVDLKFLLIVENWNSPYSKWLNTKLSLRISQEGNVYENKVSNDKLNVVFQSLPPNNYLNKDFFSNTSFILFEAGFYNDQQVSQYQGDVAAKLKRDEGILSKIIKLVERYSYYKVQIMIVFWNISKVGISYSDVTRTLKVEEYRRNSGIRDITVCDMTMTDVNINSILTRGFDQLGDSFTGELTKRGLRKRDNVRKLNESAKRNSSSMSKPPVDVDQSMEKYRSREAHHLKRAKLNRQLEYLTHHASATNATNRSHTANNTTNDATSLYLSAINSTSRLDASRHGNSTFLNLNPSIDGNNTTVNSAKDLSILTNYGAGVGILEESTPFTSPKGKSFAKPTGRNIPSNIQSLRNLTASIKEKYKKG